MVTLTILIIMALLPFIANMLTKASMDIAFIMMDSNLLNYTQKDKSVFRAVVDAIFSPNGAMKYFTNANGNVDAGVIMRGVMGFAIVLTMMFVMVGVIVALRNSMAGEPAENPIKILAKGILTILLMYGFYGNPQSSGSLLLGNVGSGLEIIGKVASAALAQLPAITGSTAAGNSIQFSASIAANRQLVFLILNWALFKGTAECGIVFMERWLSLSLSVMFGPIAIAFLSCPSSNDTFKVWLKSIVSQFLVIYVSMFIWRFYLGALCNLGGMDFGVFSGDSSPMFVHYAIALGFLALYKNSEKIINSWGLQTISNGDTAREYRGAAQAVGGTMRMMAMPFVNKAVANDVGSKIHSEREWAKRNLKNGNPIRSGLENLNSLYGAADSNSIVGKGAGAIVSDGKIKDENGNFVPKGMLTLPAKPTDGTLAESVYRKNLKTAVGTVNQAVKDGVGTTIPANQLALATGMSKMDNFQTGDGKVVQMKNGTMGIMFKGAETTPEGITKSGTYVMSLSNQELDARDKSNTILADHGLSYNLNDKEDAISLNHDSGYIYKADLDKDHSAYELYKDKVFNEIAPATHVDENGNVVKTIYTPEERANMLESSDDVLSFDDFRKDKKEYTEAMDKVSDYDAELSSNGYDDTYKAELRSTKENASTDKGDNKDVKLGGMFEDDYGHLHSHGGTVYISNDVMNAQIDEEQNNNINNDN